MTSDTLATVTFIPVPDDYQAVYASALTQYSRHYRLKSISYLMVPCWLAIFTTLVISDAVSLRSLLTGAISTMCLMWGFALKLWPSPEKSASQQYQRAKNPQFFQSRTISLEELGVRLVSENANLWHRWAVVKSVVITDQHLFVTTGSGVFFVPRRSFDQPEEFLAFARIAQQRYAPPIDQTPSRGFEVVMNTNAKNGS